ncbi:MAG: penicillin-binding protein 1C [Bacteroidota bacterium]
MSFVLEDRQGQLLGARIAADGQWRFPAPDSIPWKFERAILEFEDRRFYRHPGVDLRGVGRALIQNIRNRKVVSGASTITMQTIRLARGPRTRSIWQKLLETIQATRLELGSNKNEILTLYATHAPFGGNVVGLEAASWRYFGKSPNLLSWGESALLAVLPNSPGLMHPGRNRQLLLEKRNRLLDRLVAQQIIDPLSGSLAKEEPLPERPLPLPRNGFHLLERARRENTEAQSRIRSTLDKNLQTQVEQAAKFQLQRLKDNGIHNLAIIIAEVETGAVRAYVGNVLGTGFEHGEQVDCITAPRSTGSILKPFLFSQMVQAGRIGPQSMIRDIPTTLAGYRPENFHEGFDGMVTAQRALIRSLNVPFVFMLQEQGVPSFYHYLKKLGLKTLFRAPQQYGLPLVLGGAEASLWDLSGAYASLARTLTHFQDSGAYYESDLRSLHYQIAPPVSSEAQEQIPLCGAGAIYQTFEAMRQLERPSIDGHWETFHSGQNIAWKTGTSFGFRDAWAIGVNSQYVVGVWAGNADGEGRAGLVGIQAAAPILFDVFNRLPVADWFVAPYNDLQRMSICSNSGFRPLPICPTDTVWASPTWQEGPPCSYHQTLYLDPEKHWRVHQQCQGNTGMEKHAWFSLPPVAEHYYRQNHPNYEPLPPWAPECTPSEGSGQVMQWIYPRHRTEIYVPVDLDGERSRTVFKVAHTDEEAILYWHLDTKYLGSTQHFHSMELNPSPGFHEVTLVDQQGNQLKKRFEILEKRE